MIYFSKETNGFYDSEIHTVMPNDAVEITVDEHLALLEEQSKGKKITSDDNGNPILVDPTPMPIEDTLQPLSKRQFMLYLYDNNKLDEVNTLLSQDARTKLEFDSSDKIERKGSTVLAMINALNLTDDQVNSMWQAALLL